ncbi:MAG: Fis family transcriptional regulator, partial [Sphingopyxis sp.]
NEGALWPLGATRPQAFSARIMASTRVDLGAAAHGGAFDLSLFYRLGGFVLRVPPLRNRREDIVPLFNAFLNEASADMDGGPPPLSAAVWRRLQDHHWPGNVRELRSFAATVALGINDAGAPAMPPPSPDEGLKQTMARFEESVLRGALERLDGSVTATMAAMQLPRKTLYDRFARYGIDPRAYRPGRAATPPAR